MSATNYVRLFKGDECYATIFFDERDADDIRRAMEASEDCRYFGGRAVAFQRREYMSGFVDGTVMPCKPMDHGFQRDYAATGTGGWTCHFCHRWVDINDAKKDLALPRLPGYDEL